MMQHLTPHSERTAIGRIIKSTHISYQGTYSRDLQTFLSESKYKSILSRVLCTKAKSSSVGQMYINSKLSKSKDLVVIIYEGILGCKRGSAQGEVHPVTGARNDMPKRFRADNDLEILRKLG